MKQYKSVDGLLWVNHGDQILVVDKTGMAHLLAGTEAALWRWLHQAYAREEIRALFSALINGTEPEADARLDEVLQQWLGKGLVEVKGG
jgi:hypothetical protein